MEKLRADLQAAEAKAEDEAARAAALEAKASKLEQLVEAKKAEMEQVRAAKSCSKRLLVLRAGIKH
eukprot:739346-Prorocentrum_minimum.AAC.2